MNANGMQILLLCFHSWQYKVTTCKTLVFRKNDKILNDLNSVWWPWITLTPNKSVTTLSFDIGAGWHSDEATSLTEE